MKRYGSWQAFVTLLVLMLASGVLLAQSTGGRILGRVNDTTGAAIPDATVTITNQATGVSTSSTTSGSGDFEFLQVAVGAYTVTTGRSGFKQSVLKDVVLQLNQVLTINPVLQVGGKNETVTVSGEAPLVDTTSTQLGAVVDSKAVTGLPLNSRDTYQLLQLQPGVQGVGGSDLFYGSNTAGAVSVNGGRGRSNNFSINGGDGNDLFVNGPAIEPSPDTIQEFRVLTNTFDAEYGRNSGSVVNVVTKSGANAWHGSLYEFFRNKVLDAKGFLDPTTPDNKQNQFGGTFGGPIKKDRTFFFSSYEGRRIVQGITGDPVNVPNAAERLGDFSASPLTGVIGTDAMAQILNNRPGCLVGAPASAGTPWITLFPNSQIPPACFDPVAASLMNLYVPCPNADPTCSNLNSSASNVFQSIPDERSHANQFTTRFDHRINDRQNLTIYYYFNDSFDAQPFTRFQAETPNLLPGFGNNSAIRSQQANITHDWTLSSSSVNEIRFTYFREADGTFLHPQRTNLVTQSCGTGPVAALCFTGATDVPGVITPDPKLGITPGLGPNREGVPFIDIAGGFTIGNDFEGEIPQIGNTYQLADNWTKVLGNHTLKFGVDYRNQRFLQTLFFDPQGQFLYSGGGSGFNDPLAFRGGNTSNQNLFPNYLLGLPDTYLQGSTQTEDVRGNAVYLFGQDSWKIKPNLTLNYGLRWEFNQPFYDAGKRYQTFRPGQADTVFPCQITAQSVSLINVGVPVGSDCGPNGAANSVFPLGLVVPGDKGVPQGLTKPYYSAFAPRIGISWDPWGNGKNTVRAGFGVFYNPIEQLVLEQFQGEPPFGGSSFFSENFFSTPFLSQGCTVPCGTASAGVFPNPFNGIINPQPGQAVDWSLYRPFLIFGELQPNLRSQYTEQYNLEIQHQLSNDMVLTVGYVGEQGHRLLATHDLNFGNAQTCLDLDATLGAGTCLQFFADSPFFIPPGTTIAPQGLHLPYNAGAGGLFVPGGTVVGAAGITLVGLRPFSSPFCQPLTGTGCPPDGIPVFSSIFAQDTLANSAYNSLQASLEKRFAHGLQFEAAYTYSKSLDDGSSFESALKPICNGVAGDLSCNRGLSLFDARHRFVLSYLWDIPAPKFQGAKGKLVDGWAVSGITTFQAGFPIRLSSSADQELENSIDFETPGKPDLVAPFHTLDPRTNGGLFFDPNSFAFAQLGSLGDAPRNICCGPGISNFDFSVQKTTVFKESQAIEFRAEFFNIFNHTQFLNPDGNISDGPDFGRVKHTREPRQIQFALKYSF